MKITIEIELKEIADVLLTLKNQSETENARLYPEGSAFSDCMKDVLETVHDTFFEHLKENSDSTGKWFRREKEIRKGSEIVENKEKFVEELGRLLMMYSRETVSKLRYVRQGQCEFVEIIHKHGGIRRIHITGDSCIAIMKDIYSALL